MSSDDARTPPQPSATPDEGASGDYSYDLAHEVPDSVLHPAESTPESHGGPERPRPATDPGGDYSYDLAHEAPDGGG